jgi:hypothetical protein
MVIPQRSPRDYKVWNNSVRYGIDFLRCVFLKTDTKLRTRLVNIYLQRIRISIPIVSISILYKDD